MNEQTTLRDQLEAAFETQDDQGNEQAEVVQAAPEVEETAEQKAARERDERGRFVAKQGEEKPSPVQAAPVVTEAPKPRPARPSTWKKDIAEKYWDAIDPELAEYLQTREQQYASGVSAYKQEWERAKPLVESMQEFMPILQQHNLDPAQWIRNLGNAHRMLALGTPEQKAMWFQKLAQDYGVQLGDNGGGNPAVAGFVNELQQLKQELNHFKTAAQKAEEARTKEQIATWSSGKPHFEKVRETMAQLLESGVVTDLDTAYSKAIRLHDDLFEQEQQERARAQEEERRQKSQAAVQQAKANAVSVKGATPSSVQKASTAKGLRATLEAAAEEHLSSRV